MHVQTRTDKRDHWSVLIQEEALIRAISSLRNVQKISAKLYIRSTQQQF
jgi:hypothetical protein